MSSTLEPESGIWYAVCWLVLLTRLISSRLHNGSWKEMWIDDYLTCIAMIFMTVLMSTMHIVVYKSSNLIAPGEDISKFSQTEIKSRIVGSKLVLVTEQMQCCTIWLVKACLLVMYTRLTALLSQYRILLIVATYTALGFVVMEVLYFGVWCRPFSQYWAVPTSNPQCSAATNHLITNAILNLSSDIMIITIPMPLVFKVRLPLKKKIILIGIFMIGVFNMIAAVLNKYYSFKHPFGSEWTKWYLREAYTAFLCANLPLTYPLIQRLFKLRNWSHNSFTGRSVSDSRYRQTGRSVSRSQHKSYVGETIGKSSARHEGISKTVDVKISRSVQDLQRSESEERIYGPSTSRIYDHNPFEAVSAHVWVPGATFEMTPTSPTSDKQGSIKTTESVTSMEEAHVRQ